MKKSYFDKNKGCYIDTTRNIEYYPKNYCEICGASYPLSVHHYIPQQTCKKAVESVKVKFPKTLTQELINERQKLYTVCFQCHADIHSMSKERFYDKYGLNLDDFIYKQLNR